MSADSPNEDALQHLHRTDPWIAAITAERVARTLKGFQLPLADGWNEARLSEAIQDVASAARGEPPQGDSEAIIELTKLADRANELRRGISRLGETAETAAFFEVLRRFGEARTRINYDEDYKPVMLQPLQVIAEVFAGAASQLSTRRKQAPGWKLKSNQERRVAFAIALTPVFQSAFDSPARANNWRAEYGEEHPWPDFFRRIYGELFPETKRLNLPEVLQEAARELPRVEEFKDWLRKQEASRLRNICE